MSQQIIVDGVSGDVQSNTELIDAVVLPSLRALDAPDGASRAIVLLAGPPGAGKSTLLAQVEQRSEDDDGEPVDVVGMDGFHYRQEYLDDHRIERDGETILLADIKGAPETFDVERLQEFIRRTLTEDTVLWPRYDRNLHDPVDESIAVERRIVLVEGNWLLLDEEPWNQLRDDAAMTIFLDADPEMLRERLISRKARGDLSRREAEEFYESSDGPNVERCLNNTMDDPDLVLSVREDGTITKGQRDE